MRNLYVILLVTTVVYSGLAIPDEFIRNNNENSISIYKLQELTKNQKDSYVFGIFPLEAIMALMSYGANGDTAKEIRSAFRWNSSDAQLAEDFKRVIKELENIPDFKINLSNRVYIRNEFDVNPSFLDKASDFGTSVVKVDFKKAEKINEDINSWVEKRTNKKIKQWFDKKYFTHRTNLVLLTNIYVNGRWLKGFEKESTNKMDFHLSEYESVKVNMMKLGGYFMVSRCPVLRVTMLKLPFMNERAYMVILLTDEIDGLNSLANIARKLWLERKFTREYLTVYLPKIEKASTIDMTETLKNMGISKLFSSPDLSGIDKAADVSIISQKIYVGVDERGVSADDKPITLDNRIQKQNTINEEPKVFRVDHPFLFGILYDDLSLMFAHITKP